jgi:hypothetical protein
MLFNRGQGGGGNALIRGLSPAAWFRLGQGITVTGAGVSTWADQSGNGRDLLQATDTNRPALQADGSILFDGVDNFLQTAAFTMNQPFTWYLLMKQVTWTSGDHICNGLAANTALYQSATTPRIRQFAGTSGTENADLVLNAYGVVAAVFNNASSVLQVNNGTPVTAAAIGASNAGGFTIGGDNAGNSPAHVQVKEIILFTAAHDAAQRASVIAYLSGVGGL